MEGDPMELKLKQEVEMYIQAHEQETYELLKTLARIPAPSGQEEGWNFAVTG